MSKNERNGKALRDMILVGSVFPTAAKHNNNVNTEDE